MNAVGALIVAVWTMLPAYVPNNVAVLAGGGRPIDGGRTWGEARLLGDGKTWRGTAAGIAAGALVALGLTAIEPGLDPAVPAELPRFPLAAVLTLPAGAMLGDVLASFLKRRMDRERGAAVPMLDQLDFVVAALALTALAAPGWTLETFTPAVLAVVLVVTPVLHVGTNYGAYRLGLKEVPW